MGKTRNLFIDIRNIKGNFQARRAWWREKKYQKQERCEEVAIIHGKIIKKIIFMTHRNNHNVVVIHLEPDILEFESSGP